MTTGIFFIVMGVLVAMFPQILIAIVSGLLILIGLIIMSISWRWRRLRRASESPVVNWMMRW